jgi:hypothetical protein
MCVVLSGLYPCKVDYQFEFPRHPQKLVWRACSPSPNIEFQLHNMLYDKILDENDYFVVMIYDDHIIALIFWHA